MTEGAWLACADPAVMVEFLGEDGTRSGCALVSERKLRLWVEACRRATGRLGSANALATPAEVERAAHDWCLDGYWIEECPLALRAALLRDLVGNPWQPAPLRWEGGKLEVFAGCAQHGFQLSLTAYYDPCGWLTPTVLSLARTAYEQRLPDGFLDPARLLVLSDALEEAGCVEEPILRHLRGREPCPQCQGRGTNEDGGWDCGPCKGTGWVALRSPHAPGCFCLDLLLGQE